MQNHLLVRFVWLIAGLTLACTLPASLVNLEAPSLQTQPRAGLISYLGSDGNIYIVDPGGHNTRGVTSDAVPGGEDARVYQLPTWSPDGRRLAFLGFRGSGSEISSASLYTVEASGKGLVEAFTSENYFPFYLYWTPDSQSISFLSNGVTESGLVLHLVPATGGVSSILGVGQPFYWAWSPDSDRLIIHTGGAYATNPDAQLAFLSLDNEHENSSLGLIPAAFQAPDWSTDGERIVVASQGGDGQRELVLTGRDGAQQQVLATFVGMAIFSISPNSRMLAFSLEAFVADNPGGLMRDLFVMDLAPGAAGSQITQDLILGFFWSPDSSKIAYYAPVLSTPGSSKETAPMPVELRIGLFTLDVGTWEINRLAIFSPTDPFLEILPFYDQYQRSVTIWSPDSSQIVFTGIGADGEQGVYVVRADGSAEPQRIASGGLAFWSWK